MEKDVDVDDGDQDISRVDGNLTENPNIFQDTAIGLDAARLTTKRGNSKFRLCRCCYKPGTKNYTKNSLPHEDYTGY